MHSEKDSAIRLDWELIGKQSLDDADVFRNGAQVCWKKERDDATFDRFSEAGSHIVG